MKLRTLFKWNSLLLFFLLSTTLFLPLMLVSSVDISFINSALEDSVHSNIVRFFSACSISACVPLLFDLCLDMIFIHPIKMIYFRFVSLLSLIIFNIALLTSVYSNHTGLIFVTFSYWQIFVQIGLITWMFSELDDYSYWNDLKIVPMVFLFYVLILLEFISDSDPSTNPTLILALRFVFGVSFLLLYIYCFWLWSSQLYHQYRQSKLPFDKWRHLISYNDYTIFVVFIFSILIVPVYATFIFWGTSQNPSNNSSESTPLMLSGAIVVRSIISLFSSLIPGRIFKAEAQQTMAELRTKHSFVKYVSHNIRTPINVLSMGLECAEIDMMQDEQGHETTISTIGDLKMSCSNALDILDDVLLFDQLESGEFEIHCQPENPLNLLREHLRAMQQIATKNMGVLIEFVSADQRLRTANVLVDADRMREVLERTINAALHNRDSGQVVQVRVSLLPKFSSESRKRFKLFHRNVFINKSLSQVRDERAADEMGWIRVKIPV